MDEEKKLFGKGEKKRNSRKMNKNSACRTRLLLILYICCANKI